MKNGAITINAKLITPLCQIDSSSDGEVRLKKRRVILDEAIDDKKVLDIPVYTANGFRGLLRRVIGSLVFQKAVEKGIKVNLLNFHAIMCGGSSEMKKRLSLEEDAKIRELNPVASLLGFGLAVEGKLIVTDLVPKMEHIRYTGKVIGELKMIKKDDILEKTKFGRFINVKDAEEWIKKVNALSKKKKDSQKEGNAEATKFAVGIKYIQKVEYVIPNVELIGNIYWKYDLTDVELGALLKGLTLIPREQLGSFKHLGFGVVNYKIEYNEGVFLSEVLESNLFERKETEIPVEWDEYIEKFDEWLENLSPENLQIAEMTWEEKKK